MSRSDETTNLRVMRLEQNSNQAWIECWEIVCYTGLTLYLTNNNEVLTIDGIQYWPWPIKRQPIERDSDGNVTELLVDVCNIGRDISMRLENGWFRGQLCTLKIFNESTIASNEYYSERFYVRDVTTTDSWATFRLGAFNLFERPFPANRFLRTRCGRVYGGTDCGYDTTRSGALTTCDKTLSGANGCEAHGTDEVAAGLVRLHPLRFGGFPSIMKGPYA